MTSYPAANNSVKSRISRPEKGGFLPGGINLAPCENPLPPLEKAIEAARNEMPLSNHHYTKPYSLKLRETISQHIDVHSENIYINTGSELILR